MGIRIAACAMLGVLSLTGLPQARAEADQAGEDIVVTARRSGAPMWTIQTSAGNVILVGEIVEVPKATPWRPERLEGATSRAQRVIIGTKGKVSPGDVFRLLFRGDSITKLPKGRVAGDYLTSSQLARLHAIETRFGQDYERKNFLITAHDLLSKRLSFDRNTGDDATEVVRRSAQRARIPVRPVGEVRGEDMLDNLFEASPTTHISCLEAAMTAADAGADVVTERGRAWTGFDVPAVMDNPVEAALGQCWPWTSDGFGTLLRDQWLTAINDAASQPGTTLAVVPLRILAEPAGLLDQLAKKYAIEGPEWKRASN